MSVFLDTGVLVALSNAADGRHADAVRLVDAVRHGVWGHALTSDYVFDESVTLLLARTRRTDAAVRLGELILGTGSIPRWMSLAYVSPRAFLRAWALFSRFAGKGLSFTDCTSVELMRALGVDRIASFDAGFDGVVPRVSSADDATGPSRESIRTL